MTSVFHFVLSIALNMQQGHRKYRPDLVAVVVCFYNTIFSQTSQVGTGLLGCWMAPLTPLRESADDRNPMRERVLKTREVSRNQCEERSVAERSDSFHQSSPAGQLLGLTTQILIPDRVGPDGSPSADVEAMSPVHLRQAAVRGSRVLAEGCRKGCVIAETNCREGVV